MALTKVSFSMIEGQVASVHDFGAVGDGIVDDTVAIQNAINSLANTGGTVFFAKGVYRISSTLTVETSNIMLLGEGPDSNHDIGLQGALAATLLQWVGPSGGTMVRFQSPAGVTNQKKSGGGVKNIQFSANSVAGIGLQIISWYNAIFQNIHFSNPTDWGIDIDCVASLGEARDTQYCRFSQCSSRHSETPGGTGGLIRLNSSFSGANPSLNYFELMDCLYANGTAYELGDCDNNIFIRCRAFRAFGSGIGILCKGSNTSPFLVPRSNIFLHFTGTSATSIICRGTSSFTYPSYDNNFLLLDADNSTPAPTIETGASAYWSSTNGTYGPLYPQGIGVGEDAFDTLQAKALKNNTDSVFIVNESDGHIILSNSAGTAKWRLYLNSGNMTIGRIAGSGYLDLATGGALRIDGQPVTLGAADSGGTGFKVLRVPN